MSSVSFSPELAEFSLRNEATSILVDHPEYHLRLSLGHVVSEMLHSLLPFLLRELAAAILVVYPENIAGLHHLHLNILRVVRGGNER